MSDPFTEGEKVWISIVDAAGFSGYARHQWFEPCKVKRYEPGERLVIDAGTVARAEGLRAYFAKTLGESRDRVMPGLKLAITVAERT